jgi:beta-xylosidase
MKRTLIVFGLLIFLLSACGGASPQPANTQPPAASPTNTTPPQPTNTIPPQPTDTALLPPIETAPPMAFRDDFEGTLAEGWQWLAERSDYWNLTDTPGSLRIIAQRGGLNASEPKNILVHPAPEGNFEIATQLVFTPNSNFQIAGLIIYQDVVSFLQFGRGFAACDNPTVCAGNAIYFDNVFGGQTLGTNLNAAVEEPSMTYLRLRRIGTTYTGYYSADGVIWIEIGQQTNQLSPLMVGLVAHQAFEQEVPADFNYFTIELLP